MDTGFLLLFGRRLLLDLFGVDVFEVFLKELVELGEQFQSNLSYVGVRLQLWLVTVFKILPHFFLDQILELLQVLNLVSDIAGDDVMEILRVIEVEASSGQVWEWGRYWSSMVLRSSFLKVLVSSAESLSIPFFLSVIFSVIVS